MLTLAICLYLLGSLLVLSILDVADGGSTIGLVVMAILWPLFTIHIVLYDIFFPDEE